MRNSVAHLFISLRFAITPPPLGRCHPEDRTFFAEGSRASRWEPALPTPRTMRRTQRLQIAHGFSNAHVPQKQKRPLPEVPLTVAAQNQLALLLYAISLHAPVRTQQQGHDAGPSKPAANRRMQLTVSAAMPWSKLKVRGGFLTVQPNHCIHRHQEMNPFPRSRCPLCSLW